MEDDKSWTPEFKSALRCIDGLDGSAEWRGKCIAIRHSDLISDADLSEYAYICYIQHEECIAHKEYIVNRKSPWSNRMCTEVDASARFGGHRHQQLCVGAAVPNMRIEKSEKS